MTGTTTRIAGAVARRAGLPALLAIAAILGSACLLQPGSIPLRLAWPGAGSSENVAAATVATPAADAPASNSSSGSLPQAGDSAEAQAPAPVTAEAEAPDAVGVAVTLGRSVEGRPLDVVELGSGPRWVAVIGGIHQGNEANTSDLVKLLLEHFQANLDLIPDGVGLAFIPDINPDGAVAGTRANANGVDLNRNWDADWQPDSYGPYGLVVGGGGTEPFSEPETRLLARYLVARPFVAAIFYHSRGGMVVPGHGDDGRSVELARVIAAAAEYLLLTAWTAYPLSGQAADYLAYQDIHAVDVELTNYTDPDFTRNLRGLNAALAWAQTLDVSPGAERNIPAQISSRCGCQLGVDCGSVALALCLW